MFSFGSSSSHNVLHDFKKTYDILESSATSPALAVETIRRMAEFVVRADQNDVDVVFDYFCEQNTLSLYLRVLCDSASLPLAQQIIQTCSIIVQNLRSDVNLFYVLSNNRLNLILLKVGEILDATTTRDQARQETLAHFVSFLKVLSLSLDLNTVQFFFVDNTFPLFTLAMKLFDDEEGMIRNAVRTITLSVYKLQYPPLMEWLVSDPQSSSFFGALGDFLRYEAEFKLLPALRDALIDSHSATAKSKLDYAYQEQTDSLYYVKDLLTHGFPKARGKIVAGVYERYLCWLMEDGLFLKTDPLLGLASLYLLAQIFILWQSYECRRLVDKCADRILSSLETLFSDNGDVVDERIIRGIVCLIYGIVKNAVVSREILEARDASPARARVAAALFLSVSGVEESDDDCDESHGRLFATTTATPLVISDDHFDEEADAQRYATPVQRTLNKYPLELVGHLLSVLSKQMLSYESLWLLTCLLKDLCCDPRMESLELIPEHSAALEFAATHMYASLLDADFDVVEDSYFSLVGVDDFKNFSRTDFVSKISSNLNTSLSKSSVSPSEWCMDGIKSLVAILHNRDDEDMRSAICFTRLRCLLHVDTSLKKLKNLHHLLSSKASEISLDQPIDLRRCEYVQVRVSDAHLPAYLILVAGAVLLVEPHPSKSGRGCVRFVAPLHRVEVGHESSDDRKLHLTSRSRREVQGNAQLGKWILNQPEGARTPQGLGSSEQLKHTVLGEMPQFHAALTFASPGVASWTKQSLLDSKSKTRHDKIKALGVLINDW